MSDSEEESLGPTPEVTPRTAAANAAKDAIFEEQRIRAQKRGKGEAIAVKGANAKKSDPAEGGKNERPACFMAIMAKAKHGDKYGRYGDMELNKRFMSTMFMQSIDTEAVSATMEALDLEQYADGVSMTTLLARKTATRKERLERKKEIEEEALSINRDGEDCSTVSQRPSPRKPQFSLDNRTDPTRVFPTAMSLPNLTRRPIPGSTSVGTLGSSIMHNSASLSIAASELHDAYSVEARSRQAEAEEAKTVVTLPSVHTGVTLTVPAKSIDRYFGKEARKSFFDHYRSMVDSNLSFTYVNMGQNEDGQWVNRDAKLQDEVDCDKEENPPEVASKALASPAAPASRSGWDGRLNGWGQAVHLLESPRGDVYPERAISPRELVLPYKSSKRDPLDGGESPEKDPLGRLTKSSLWASDLAAFKRGIADLDATLLSAPAHNYYDTFRDRFTNGQSGTTLSNFGNQESSDDGASFCETQSVLTDRLSQLALPSLSEIGDSSGMQDAVNRGFISPRTKFIASCIDRGLAPLPSLVMRKLFNTKINLSHFGIGDARGCAFAECLVTLPSIESINLCDNNLTDVSLYPLINACSRIPGLRELNLSRNKIDSKASAALAAYLSSPKCPLYRLVLDASDVDDGECASFVECLETNLHLREVDLSNNLLGSEESIPGARTGGAALADYLVSKGCRLKYLKLAWNGIRQTTAMTFGRALGKNTTLTFLDLSYNGLGSAAGEIIGDSIIDNKTLQTLILDNNNLGSTACVTICIGVCQNFAIKRISLNENPIGEAGAKMVMQVPVLIGNRVDLSAANCNTVMRDQNCWYDQANPCRNYSLDLSNAFERAVAFSVLQVVASHSSYIVAKAQFQEDKTNYDVRNGASVVKKFGNKEEISLVQGVANDKEDYFDADQKAIVMGLRTMLDAASNTEKGKKLFAEADLDGGGDLDREELRIVMERLGLASEPDKMAEILYLFDLDGTGVMNMHEFLAVLKAQCREADARLKEMTTYPVLCLKEHVHKHKKYIPPRQGMLHLTVVDGFEEKETFSVLSSSDQSNALNMAMKMGDSALINEAVRASKIRYTEAEALFRRMYKESGIFAASIARLLPQMKTNAEAKQLVSKVTGEDRNKIAQIKQALGIASKTIFGMYNGYYQLDLTLEYHRVCLSRLFEQSSRFNAKRAMACWLGYGKLGDTSQHGNWSSFRNEYFNKEPIEVTSERFTPMPRSGILEFDFSGAVGPTQDDAALSDAKLCNVLHNLYLLKDETDKQEAENLLGRNLRELLFHKAVMKGASRLQQEKALRPEGKKSVYECPRSVSQEQGLACDAFYKALPERRNEMRRYAQNEVIGVNFAPGEVTAEDLMPTPTSTANTSQRGSPTTSAPGSPVKMGRKALSPQITRSPSPLMQGVIPRVPGKEGAAGEAQEDTLHPLHLELPEDEEDPELVNVHPSFDTNAEDELSVGSEAVIQDARKRGIELLRNRLEALVDGPMSHKISGEAKAARFCEVVEETFSTIWLDCRQVAFILQKVPHSELPQSENFGSYSVSLAVSLFGRIVDPHNVDIILRSFSAHDAGCFWCRIGFLNLFNPTKPEGTLEMNLARREENIVARMFIYLSVVEPGNNMPQPFFKWKRSQDPTPGFEITAPWATPEGLPKKGNLGITFYSGGGEELEGCKVNKLARRALLQLVLADEAAVDKDPLDEGELIDLDAADHTPNSAMKLLQSEGARKLWDTYLWPGCLKEEK